MLGLGLSLPSIAARGRGWSPLSGASLDLDFARGSALLPAPELIKNASAADWTQSLGTLTWTNGVLRVTANGAAAGRAIQTLTGLPRGKTIKVDFTVASSGTGATAFASTSTNSTGALSSTASLVGAAQSFTFVVPESGTVNLLFSTSGVTNGAYAEFSNFSVKEVDPGLHSLTVTRASPGMAETVAGQWVDFPVNTPRITDKGLLTEEARTNVLRNGVLAGSAAGTPGTLPNNVGGFLQAPLARQVIGPATRQGVDGFVIRFFGAAGVASGIALYLDTQFADATAAQVWSSSAFVELIAGSLDGINNVRLFHSHQDAGGAALAANYGPSYRDAVAGGGLQRIICENKAPPANTTKIRLALECTHGTAPVDFTIFVGLPQLEQGAFATSPIRTTGAVATRAADLVTVPAPVGDAYSMFAQATPQAPLGQGNQHFAHLDNGTINNRTSIYRGGGAGDIRYNTVYNTAAQSDFGDLGQVLAGSLFRGAVAVAANDSIGAGNGRLFGVDSVVTVPTGLNRLVIGSSGSSGSNAYIERVALFPTRLSNANLIRLTLGQDIDQGLWSFPVASLDMDFASDRYVGEHKNSLVVTRASEGMVQRLDGTWISVPANQPRISDRGLLVEEARTNLFTHTDLENAYWLKYKSVLSSTVTTTAPDGSTVRKLVATTSGGTVDVHQMSANVTVPGAGQVYTYSVFVKGGDFTRAELQLNGAGAVFGASVLASYDLSTKSVFAVGTGVASTQLIPGPDGWFRLVLTTVASIASGAVSCLLQLSNPGEGFVGDDSRGSFWWHPQFEQGPFPTSPIRTTGAAATRAADVVYASAGTWLAAGKGTLYAEWATTTPPTSGKFPTPVALTDGTLANRVSFTHDGANSWNMAITAASATQSLHFFPYTYTGSTQRAALAFAANDVHGARDGGLLNTLDTTATIPAFSRLDIGGLNGGNQLNGYVRRVSYFPERLGNNEIAAITKSGLWAFDGAAVDMDFARNFYSGARVSDLTVSRATSGLAQRRDGSWVEFGPNQARITDRGLLLETPRTNHIRNNTGQGAVIGSPGVNPLYWSISPGPGLSKAIVGKGVQNGLDYVDVRIFGSGTAAGTSLAVNLTFEPHNGVAAAVNQVWTHSGHIQLVGGALPVDTTGNGVRVVITERKANNTDSYRTGPQIIDGTIRRYVYTATLAQADVASIYPGFWVYMTDPQAVDFTLRIFLPQLEQAPFASSPIKTTGVAAVRAADSVSLPLTPGQFANGQLTMFAQAFNGKLSGLQTYLQAADGPNWPQDWLTLRLNSGGNQHIFITHASAMQSSSFPVAGTPAADTRVKLAAKTNGINTALLVSTGTPTAIVPAAQSAVPNYDQLDRLMIGCDSLGSNQPNAYMERVALIPANVNDTLFTSLVA